MTPAERARERLAKELEPRHAITALNIRRGYTDGGAVAGFTVEAALRALTAAEEEIEAMRGEGEWEPLSLWRYWDWW